MIALSLFCIFDEMILDTFATEERTASLLRIFYVFLYSCRPSCGFCLSLQVGLINFHDRVDTVVFEMH